MQFYLKIVLQTIQFLSQTGQKSVFAFEYSSFQQSTGENNKNRSRIELYYPNIQNNVSFIYLLKLFSLNSMQRCYWKAILEVSWALLRKWQNLPFSSMISSSLILQQNQGITRKTKNCCVKNIKLTLNFFSQLWMKQYFLGGIIQYLIQLHYMNPFAALDIQDEEEDFKQVPQQPKAPKKTHQQRKEAKERKIKEAQTAKTVSNVNENIEEAGKEKKQKHYKERPIKGVPEGHTHDRRSGTGRHDRPRKQGGGKGNVGNVKDELNKEKYIKQNETEDKVQEEEEKPEEPQPITLDQYYKNKGIEIDEHLPKEPVKKGEINAEWIKKENLTLMKTKEDMRKEVGGSEYTKKSFNSSLGGNQQHSQMLGFGNKKTRQEKKDRDREEEKPHPKKKKEKVVLKEEDFPTL